ncbi:MAG: hypothetical protein WBG70_21155 [Spirulinaceae cyanobacterium]
MTRNKKRLFTAVVTALFAGFIILSSNLVKAQTPLDSQTQVLRTPTERLEEWLRISPTEPIPAGIFFAQRIPDARLLQIMRRYDVQPKAIFMSVTDYFNFSFLSISSYQTLS